MAPHHRLPISARHAFALAFDLAVRRDAVQSLWVPFLLHTPWLVARVVLPAPDDPAYVTPRSLLLHSVVMLGEFIVTLLIAAMLRFRARSVFNTPAGAHATSAFECYKRAAGRLPWLFVTELLRNTMMFAAGVFLVLPGLWVGFRLSMATEAAVLRDTSALGAFTRSFQLTGGRLERWLEMIAISVVVVLTLLFTCAVFFFALPSTSWATWLNVALFLLPPVMTVIQYAWTFFYLRLEEIDRPLIAGSIRPHSPIEPHAGDSGGGTSPGSPPRLVLLERHGVGDGSTH